MFQYVDPFLHRLVLDHYIISVDLRKGMKLFILKWITNLNAFKFLLWNMEHLHLIIKWTIFNNICKRLIFQGPKCTYMEERVRHFIGLEFNVQELYSLNSIWRIPIPLENPCWKARVEKASRSCILTPKRGRGNCLVMTGTPGLGTQRQKPSREGSPASWNTRVKMKMAKWVGCERHAWVFIIWGRPNGL